MEWLDQELTDDVSLIHIQDPTVDKFGNAAQTGCTVTLRQRGGREKQQHFPEVSARDARREVQPRVLGVPVVVGFGGALYAKAHPPDTRESLEARMKRQQAEKAAKAAKAKLASETQLFAPV